MQSAWKVGLFVVAFGVLLFFAYSFVGNRLLKPAQDRYYAVFSDVGGVTPGAIVTMAGVEVGTVADVKLKNPREAQVTVDVSKGTFVPADSALTVPGNLFSIGEQRLDIVSKKGTEAGRLAVGGTMPGVKASALAGILPDGEATFKELNLTLKATRELIGDPQIKGRITGVLAATEKSVNTLNALMGDARGFLAQNQSTLRSVLVNASTAVDDMRKGISAVTKEVAAMKLSENVNGILLALRNTSQQAEDLVAQINEFIGDPSIKSSLNHTTANMEQITRTGIDIAENTKAMTENGKVITSKAIELTDTAKDIASQAKDLLARLNQFMDKLPGGVKLAQPTFELSTGRNTATGRFQSDLFIDYPVGPTSSIYAGLYDATEKNQLTAQYSQKRGNNSLRYGIYASKPGVGVDYRPTPRFSLTGDLFDPNNLTFNVRARYSLGGEMFGFVGLNQVFNGNQPVIGLGVRR